MKKIRIDQLMVEKGVVPSRTKAQELIENGLVSLKFRSDQRIVKSKNEWISSLDTPEIIIAQNNLTKFVSRAGVKLESALNHLKLPVERLHILDVGISTGGFTDCLLQRGAGLVVGVDVGHNQLSQRLQSDPRLTTLEGVNAREIHSHPEVIRLTPIGGFDLAVIDVSFISLKLVLASVAAVVKTWGSVLALVKPQFEVGPDHLGHGGVVQDPELYGQLQVDMERFATEQGFAVKNYFPSALPGKDGNQEFFILIQKQ